MVGPVRVALMSVLLNIRATSSVPKALPGPSRFRSRRRSVNLVLLPGFPCTLKRRQVPAPSELTAGTPTSTSSAAA